MMAKHSIISCNGKIEVVNLDKLVRATLVHDPYDARGIESREPWELRYQFENFVLVTSFKTRTQAVITLCQVMGWPYSVGDDFLLVKAGPRNADLRIDKEVK